VTLIVAVVFLFIATSVNMFYIVLPPRPLGKKMSDEDECVELGYAKAKSA